MTNPDSDSQFRLLNSTAPGDLITLNHVNSSDMIMQVTNQRYSFQRTRRIIISIYSDSKPLSMMRINSIDSILEDSRI